MDHKDEKNRASRALIPQKTPTPMPGAKNPFKSGFVPNGKRNQKGNQFITKRALLKYMLEVDIRVTDLPVKMADQLRAKVPGFFENVDKKFTMYQILEIVQLQLLFSKSGNVQQNAINAIKDRVEGKPLQKIQVDNLDQEPTEMKLSNGRVIHI